ncbi:MAG TPA: glycosyltransferase, partial [Promineifilum sp.]|nr:glycosyltransferase [Promineifilum sp.]
GLTDAVVDAGWVALEQLPATLAAADVGLYLMDDTLLNRTKCPVKLADMLAAGVPVVAETVGQVAEYVRDGRTGLLCASGDVAELVNAATILLTDRELRMSRGVAAREDITARFDWPELSRTLEALYDRL